MGSLKTATGFTIVDFSKAKNEVLVEHFSDLTKTNNFDSTFLTKIIFTIGAISTAAFLAWKYFLHRALTNMRENYSGEDYPGSGDGPPDNNDDDNEHPNQSEVRKKVNPGFETLMKAWADKAKKCQKKNLEYWSKAKKEVIMGL